HSFVPHQVATVAAAIDGAGVDVLEVSHGDGLGGSSIQDGIAAATDLQLVEAAVASVTRTRVAVLLLPGIGTLELLKQAHAAGASVARIATHCTEADLAQQHILWARDNGMTTVGFLMMSHTVDTPKLIEQ